MTTDLANQKKLRKLSKQLPDDDPLADMGYNEYLIPEDSAMVGREGNIGVTVSRVSPSGGGLDYTGNVDTTEHGGIKDGQSSSSSSSL